MTDSQWIKCPICGAKTRVRILPTTIMKDFPLYCRHCKNETIINVADMKVFSKETTKLVNNRQ